MSKPKILTQLHHNGEMLILPNVWNPLSAVLLEEIGYKAVATASASMAYSNGYLDGQEMPFEEVLKDLHRIVNSVDIPVTADIESGYADNNTDLKENIKRLLDIGIAGINLEDSVPNGEWLIPLNEQCEKIRIIKKVAAEKGMELFINARSDVYLKQNDFSEEEKLSEIIKRGKAFKDAGADGFYPMILKNKNSIETIVNEVGLPINIILIPGVPDIETLQRIGVSRLSLGPGLLKIAINAMKNISQKLLKGEGMDEIISNPVTGDYLKFLVSKSSAKSIKRITQLTVDK